MKTSELTGTALDWAVAKAQGIKDVIIYHGFVRVPIPLISERYPKRGIGYKQYRPSASWQIGGPIIEQEIGNLWKHNKLDLSAPDVWTAAAYHKAPDGTMLYYEDGPTPLIAAMRTYVAYKLGPEVDIPQELIK